MLKRRLIAEIKELEENPIAHCSAGPINKDKLDEWEATIAGPEGTPYHGGLFKLKINFTNRYPMKPPKVKFITPIFHCNIDKRGNICLSILKDDSPKDGWTPALTVGKVLLSIVSLLNEPNPDDPLSPDIAALLKEDKAKHNEMAIGWTNKYASF